MKCSVDYSARMKADMCEITKGMERLWRNERNERREHKTYHSQELDIVEWGQAGM